MDVKQTWQNKNGKEMWGLSYPHAAFYNTALLMQAKQNKAPPYVMFASLLEFHM